MRYKLQSHLLTQSSNTSLTRLLVRFFQMLVTSTTAIDTLPSTSAAPNISKVPFHHTPTSLPPSNPIPSVSPPQSPYSSLCRLFLLDTPGETGNTFVKKPIHGFLKLRNTNVIAVVTSALAAQLLRGERAIHFTSKIPIACNESNSRNVPAEIQVVTEPLNGSRIIWDEVVT